MRSAPGGGARRSCGARTGNRNPVDSGARGVLHACGVRCRDGCEANQAAHGESLQQHEAEPKGLQRDGSAHVVGTKGRRESPPRRRRARRASRRTGSDLGVPRRKERGCDRRRVISRQQRRQIIRREQPRRRQGQQRRQPGPVKARGERRRRLEACAARGRFHGRGAGSARTVGAQRKRMLGTSAAVEEETRKCRPWRRPASSGVHGALSGAFFPRRTTRSRRDRTPPRPRRRESARKAPSEAAAAAAAASRRLCPWELAMAGMRGCVSARSAPPPAPRTRNVGLTRLPRPIRNQGGA